MPFLLLHPGCWQCHATGVPDPTVCVKEDLEESEGCDESVLKAAQRGAIPLEVTPPTPCLSFLQAGAELNAARGGGCIPSAPSSVPGF